MINLKDIRDMDTDTVLAALGVRRTGHLDWFGPAVTGLAVGLLAGSALGLLFAPQSGHELRESVKRRVDDARTSAGAALRNAQGRVDSGSQSEA